MKQLLKKTWFLALILIIHNSCRNDKIVRDPGKTYFGDLFADTIIYDVVIKNPNPEDKWAEESLKNLERKQLVDRIFEDVYSGKLSAYDYETNNLLKPEDIKTIESSENYTRDKIGKLQFQESWYFNDSTIQKKINSVVLAYEYYTSDSELFGYSALFKVVFK